MSPIPVRCNPPPLPGHTRLKLREFLNRWIDDFDFMPQAAQEGFVHQVSRGQVGRKYHDHIELTSIL